MSTMSMFNNAMGGEHQHHRHHPSSNQQQQQQQQSLNLGGLNQQQQQHNGSGNNPNNPNQLGQHSNHSPHNHPSQHNHAHNHSTTSHRSSSHNHQHNNHMAESAVASASASASVSVSNQHQHQHQQAHSSLRRPITPHNNDVLLGRGGNNNKHVGNAQLRSLARAHVSTYSRASKKDKSKISREMVNIVRNMNPPGRFLKRHQFSEEWEDVGDDVAREKASQALRDAVSQKDAGDEDPAHDQELLASVGVNVNVNANANVNVNANNGGSSNDPKGGAGGVGVGVSGNSMNGRGGQRDAAGNEPMQGDASHSSMVMGNLTSGMQSLSSMNSGDLAPQIVPSNAANPFASDRMHSMNPPGQAGLMVGHMGMSQHGLHGSHPNNQHHNNHHNPLQPHHHGQHHGVGVGVSHNQATHSMLQQMKQMQQMQQMQQQIQMERTLSNAALFPAHHGLGAANLSGVVGGQDPHSAAAAAAAAAGIGPSSIASFMNQQHTAMNFRYPTTTLNENSTEMPPAPVNSNLDGSMMDTSEASGASATSSAQSNTSRYKYYGGFRAKVPKIRNKSSRRSAHPALHHGVGVGVHAHHSNHNHNHAHAAHSMMGLTSSAAAGPGPGPAAGASGVSSVPPSPGAAGINPMLPTSDAALALGGGGTPNSSSSKSTLPSLYQQIENRTGGTPNSSSKSSRTGGVGVGVGVGDFQSSLPSLYQHIENRMRYRNQNPARVRQHIHLNDRSSIGRSSMGKSSMGGGGGGGIDGRSSIGGVETISNYSSRVASEAGDLDLSNFDWVRNAEVASVRTDMSWNSYDS